MSDRDGSHRGEIANVNAAAEETPLTPPGSLSWQIFKNPVAMGVPRSEAQRVTQFETMLPLLEPSPIIFEFLDILESTKIIPFPFGFLQRILIRAAIDILPREVRDRLDLGSDYDLGERERVFIGWLGRRTDDFGIPRESMRTGRTQVIMGS